MASNDTSNAEAEERMSAYLDHELDPEESREFEEQLASSPDARKDLDDLRKPDTAILRDVFTANFAQSVCDLKLGVTSKCPSP